MIKIIWYLISGNWGLCSHKWKKIKEIELYDDTHKFPVGNYYICECEKCGIIKKFKT